MSSINIHFIHTLKHSDIIQFKNFVEIGQQSLADLDQNNIAIYPLEPYFNMLHVVGIDQTFVTNTMNSYDGNKIHFHHLNNDSYINDIISTLDHPTIFFLRTYTNCPLFDQLPFIFQHFKHEAIIIIDGFGRFGIDNDIDEHKSIPHITLPKIINILCPRIGLIYNLPSEADINDRLVIHLIQTQDVKFPMMSYDVIRTTLESTIGSAEPIHIHSEITNTSPETTSTHSEITNTSLETTNIHSEITTPEITNSITICNNINNVKGNIYIHQNAGFGNILFRYLCAFALSKKYGMNIYSNINYTDNRGSLLQYNMFKKMNTIYMQDQTAISLKEQRYQYDEITITNPYTNYYLDGYLQSYKYSIGYIDEIKTQLLNDDYRFIKFYYNSIVPSDTLSIMLHVRRGDYVNLQHIHPVQTDEYYSRSLDVILNKISPNKYVILVFSDDIDFVNNWSLLRNYNKIVINRGTEDSWWMMTMCNHYIISNSSYSLTGYYFREHKDATLCLPQRWFGPGGPQFSIPDLVEINDNVHVF